MKINELKILVDTLVKLQGENAQVVVSETIDGEKQISYDMSVEIGMGADRELFLEIIT